MYGKEGSDDLDEQPARTDRPSLPSIQSLFGISREDDLNTLLQLDSPDHFTEPPSRSTLRASDTPPATLRKAQPPSLSLQHVTSSHPPSSFTVIDLQTSLVNPADPLTRRRSSGSQSDQPGPSRPRRGVSDTSQSPLSPPETPESASPSRYDSRFSGGKVYSPVSQNLGSRSGFALARPDAASSRYAPDRSSAPSLPASPQTSKEVSLSPSTSAHVQRRSSLNERVLPTQPIPHLSYMSDPGRRRHTIGDDSRTITFDPTATVSSSQPPRPQTATKRRTLQPPFSTLPTSWVDSPDRLLPPLTRPTQSESQRSGIRLISSTQRTTHSSSTKVPARPWTSPSHSQSHPPSSFPRHLSATTSPSVPNLSYATSPSPVTSPPGSAPSGQRTFYDPPPPNRGPYSASSSSGYVSPDETQHPPPLAGAEPPRAAASSSSAAGSAKYVCEYCQKRFNRPSSLKIHVNTHTGEKPFKCPFPGCGRRFSVMSNMRRHSRVHSQSRLNEGEGSADAELDADGEADADGEQVDPDYAEPEREAAPVSGSSAGSTRRRSGSTSRGSSSHRGGSRATPAISHPSGAQPPPSSYHPSLVESALRGPLALRPPTPEPFSDAAQQLYELSHGRPSTRSTRSGASKRVISSAAVAGRASSKRSKSNPGTDDDAGT
ncbi:hypothetical protein FRB99_004234 [Tulasnella sp. 403]|nr:hypothetical protein FRB99_004234 [Tulasnella sp. 403]